MKAFGALVAAMTCAMGAPVGAADVPDFSRDILPILSDHCFTCHGPDENARKARLRLDTHDGALAAGKSGKHAVVPGQSGASELMRRLISGDPDEVMPPPTAKRPLTSEEIDRLRRWIDGGATWGRHWAFEPPRRPALPSSPAAEGGSPVRNPIDALVVARLHKEGLGLAAEAPRRTLIRRVTLDLTGLPPAPADVDAFERDDGPDAYARLVERLLASPRYGERMAWEWLEAARYADSNGYQGDSERTMWPWRDWVVDSLNRDLPFDVFSTWQIAGDLLPDATLEQRMATGFLRNHMINGEGGRIPEENRIDYLFDQTETVGTVWLAATFNCARCHDHKYDPYTQRDYYGFMGFFNQTPVDGGGGDPQMKPNLEVPSPEQTARRQAAETRLATQVACTAVMESLLFPRDEGKAIEDAAAAAEVPKEILEHLKIAPEQRDVGRLEKLVAHWKSRDPAYAEALEAQRLARAERDAAQRAIPRVMVMADQAQRRDTFVLQRGLYTQPAAKVETGVPAGVSPSSPVEASPTNRLGLARWLMDPRHPLTARVIVNRTWQSLFGVGLVKTSEDFGVQGERPLHPDLLDWLACEFADSGWDVKHIQRLIVTSATYRQDSKVSPAAQEKDPENRLLARGPRFRMPSWMIRDVALASAGLMVGDQGGPPVKPYQPGGLWEEATFGTKRYVQDHGAALYRRSLYVFWRRIIGPSLFFDVASRQTCTVKTPRTNVPLHALLTLNDVTYVEAARALAEKVLLEGPADEAGRLDWAAGRVVGRAASLAERRILTEALARYRRGFSDDREAARALLETGESPRVARLDPSEHAAWTLVCGTLLNLDEALTKE